MESASSAFAACPGFDEQIHLVVLDVEVSGGRDVETEIEFEVVALQGGSFLPFLPIGFWPELSTWEGRGRTKR